MYPTEDRIKELRARFKVSNGRYFGTYKYKNLNWYLAASEMSAENDEWFCYGDVLETDIPRLQAALHSDEYLLLGWKELDPNMLYESVFRDGGGIWLIISPNKVVDAIELQRQNRRRG